MSYFLFNYYFKIMLTVPVNNKRIHTFESIPAHGHIIIFQIIFDINIKIIIVISKFSKLSFISKEI